MSYNPYDPDEMNTFRPNRYAPADNLTQSADIAQLKALAWIHYLWGAYLIVLSLPILAFLLLGGAWLNYAAANSPTPPDQNPLPVINGAIGFLLLVVLTLTVLHAGLKIWTGRALVHRHGYGLAVALSVLDMLHIPIGTILGGYTLYVLNQPSVKQMFGKRAA